MLTAADFFNLLAGLVESLPQHKALSERGLAFAWVTFPDAAKQQLSVEQLSYAATQRLLDPEPNQRLALHIQLLTYLYPLRDGLPATDRPVRHDLAARMQSPHTFHPLAVVQAHGAPALSPPPTLPPIWTQETIQQKRHRLERLARQTQSPVEP